MREFNFEIQDIGLRYFGHRNICELILYADSFYFKIPIERFEEFSKLFPDIPWEDGYMVHKLKGRYMRAIEGYDMNVIGLKHITKDLAFML